MNTSTFRPHTRHFIADVQQGDRSEAARLLRSQPYILSDRNSIGETALHWLAIENEPDGVRLLLENGADPDAEDHDGDFALCDAASLGHVDVIRILLEFGAKATKRRCTMPPISGSETSPNGC